MKKFLSNSELLNGKRKQQKKCLDANGKFEGYKFEEENIADQMAYLFVGDIKLML
jgi:hypothetical protein